MLKPFFCNLVSWRGQRFNLHIFAESKEALEKQLADNLPPYKVAGASQMVYDPVDREATL